MRNQLLHHLRNNENSAFEEKEGELIWKKYEHSSEYKDPQEGLIYQDHPWADKIAYFVINRTIQDCQLKN